MFRLAASKPSYEPGSPHSTGALAERRFSQQTMDCLYHLRSEGIACDGILRTQDGGEFHVHRPIMVACSTYFKALYTSPLNTDDRRDVTLPGVAAAMLRHIVDYAYTHKATIHWGNVHDLFQAADQFNVIDMVQDCVNFLVANMDPKNCIGIMKFARLFSCPPLKNAAYNYLMSNFVEVAHNSQELYKLTVGEMVDILSAEDLNVKNEEIVWETALKWIAKDPASRSRYIVALMRCVRLGLLDSQYFIEEVKNHPYVVDNQACRPLVIETLKHLYDLEITTHRDGDVLIPEIARPRMPHDVLFVMGGWSGGSATSLIETYDCRTDRWMKKHFDRSRPTKEGRLQLPESDPTGPRAYHKCAVIDFDIFVIGGFDGMGYFNSCRRFNTLTKEWREIAPMYVRRSIRLDILPQAISTQVEKASVDSPCTAARRHHMCQVARCRRCYVSVAVLDRVIYAMGGYDGQRRQNTAEKYDYKTNQRPGVVTQWLMIASMHSPRSDASATSLNGQVFITGGFDGSICMNSVESYNPATNQWTNVTPMRSRRSGVSCINYHDQLYVLGGFNGISRLCSGERYNPKTDTWTYIPDMSISRSNFAMAIIDEMIFVIGGFDGVTTIYNVESYSDKTNTWTDMTRMNIFRSALAACVVPELPNVRDYVPGDRDQSLKEKRMKVLQVQTPPYGPELLGIRSR
ncbi:KLHL10 [Cordylochernes scorpioides]|uniref:Kelch-like protein diablo n=1 Tax=Cordylochernes scorpioides TaxID=51811 RepID=A0ABY6KJI3_9ARAC|nr:KLHL10 [Cordylochernes scorpioides]